MRFINYCAFYNNIVLELYSPLEQFNAIKLFNDCQCYPYLTNIFVYLVYAIGLIIYFGVLLYIGSYFLISDFDIVLDKFLIQLYFHLCDESKLCNFSILLLVFVFFFIIFLNVIGMVPYGFTATSHIAISFFIAFSYFLYLNFLLFLRNFLDSVSMFSPSGVPNFILYIVVGIELISYSSRPISLSVRLFANMMSGHTLTHILVLFLFSGLCINIVIAVPILLLNLVIVMEFGVSLLQAYIFCILCKLYLIDTDSIYTH